MIADDVSLNTRLKKKKMKIQILNESLAGFIRNQPEFHKVKYKILISGIMS